MLILMTGATGFIGRHLAAALVRKGHEVLGCTRNVNAALAAFPGRFWIAADMNSDIDARAWRPRLYGVDAVINCAGILRETGDNTFEGVHALGPRALFEACKQARVKRVIQFSIAGAESRARSHLIAGKRYADNCLENLDIDWTVLAAAPVFGSDSALSKTLVALAQLPGVPLIDTQGALIAPIHVDDVAQAIVRLMEPGAPMRTRIALVGPQAMTLSEYITRLRHALGLGDARFLQLPERLATLSADALDLAGAGFTGRELIALMRTDMLGDVAALTELLGRPPRAVEDFVTPVRRSETRDELTV